MGVQGLFTFLDGKVSNNGVYHTNLRSFLKFCKLQRKKINMIGIDASLFLYRYSSTNIELMESQLSEFLHQLTSLFQTYHIQPLFIFDGKYHEETIQEDHQLVYEKKKSTFHSRFLHKKRFHYLSNMIHSYLLWKKSFLENEQQNSEMIERREEEEEEEYISMDSSFLSESSDFDSSMDSLEGISRFCCDTKSNDIFQYISPLQIRNKYILMNELLFHTTKQIQQNISISLYQNILYNDYYIKMIQKINKYYCEMDVEIIKHIDEFIFDSDEILENKRQIYIKKSIHMGHSKKNLFISLLEENNIPFYVPTDSYYEADLILAQLCKHNKIQAVISDDSDMLAYGTPYVFRNFHIHSKQNANFIFYDYSQILHSLTLDSNQFMDLCILCGNDYNKRLPGFYPEHSYENLKEHHVIENILKYNFKDKQLKIPKHFSFSKSRKIFQMILSNEMFQSFQNLC
jgi:5'-3' exonuclease